MFPSLGDYCASGNYIVLVESPDNKDRFFVLCIFVRYCWSNKLSLSLRVSLSFGNKVD